MSECFGTVPKNWPVRGNSDEILGEPCKERSEKKFYTSTDGPRSPEDSGIHLITKEDRRACSNELQQYLDENKMQTLIKENVKLSGELRSLQENGANFKSAARDVRFFFLRAEEDKKRLAKRIEKLAANERVLIMELERLKRHGGANATGRVPSQKALATVEDHISGLEQDRDFWKNQVELLSQMLACPSVAGSKNPLNRQDGNRIFSASKVSQGKAQKFKTEEDIRALPDAQKDIKQLKCRPSTGPALFARSRSLPREQLRDESFENQKLRLERDELQLTLNRFEKRIQEIQISVQTLTKERDDLHKLYTESRNEIHRLHHDLYDVQNTSSSHAIHQKTITRLQADLERSRREIEHLISEKEDLVAKYKKAGETESLDKQRHSKQMDYMEKALHEATSERDEIMGRINHLKRRQEEMQCNQVQIEQRLEEKNAKFKKCTDEVVSLRGELKAIQKLLEETEAKLVVVLERNSELEAACQHSEASINEVSRRLQQERETCGRLQSELQEASFERDKMQQEIEELIKEKAQLYKNNNYVEKKYMAAITERDEVNNSCNALATDIQNLANQLRNAKDENGMLVSKLQLERSTNENLTERCSTAESRLEESEFRSQALVNEVRENEEARRQLERQIKTLADDVDRLKPNVDRLGEENELLRSNIDLAIKDKAKFEACIEDLTIANRQLVRDHGDAEHRHNMAREKITELEADLKRQAEAASKDHQMIIDLKKKNETLKERCEELDVQLVETLNKHRNSKERLHQVELRAGQLERELRLEHDDYLQIRSRLEATEEQIDAEETNRKLMAQRILDLEVQLTSRLAELKEARCNLNENSRLLSRKEEQLMTSQATEQSLRSELAAAQSGLRESRRLVNAGEQECCRLSEELAAVTKDLQHLRIEIRETVEERDLLKARADSYLSELARQERLLEERARERDLLAEQARAAIEDSEMWRTHWTEAEAAATSARLHGDEISADAVRMRNTIEERERELSQCKTALDKAENQIQCMSQKIAETSEAASLARAEMEALAAEVSRLHDSLGRAEAAKNAKDREAVHARIEAEEARTKLIAAEAALLHANESATAERENARKAILQLQLSRNKEHATCLEAQERANEVTILRERAVKAEEMRDVQQCETARFHERPMEIEASHLSRSQSIDPFDRGCIITELRPFPATYRALGYSGSSGRITMSRLRSPHREKEEI